jgi:hypothetical protein
VLHSFEKHGTKMLRAVYDDLGKAVSYSDLRVMQLYKQAME